MYSLELEPCAVYVQKRERQRVCVREEAIELLIC